MRTYLVIPLILIGMALYAGEYSPAAMSVESPAAMMQSVNSPSYMTSGSNFAATVYDVGATAPYAAGVRKAPPVIGGGGTSDYDPDNPQFATLGDAVLPLLLIIMVFYGRSIARLLRKLFFPSSSPAHTIQ